MVDFNSINNFLRNANNVNDRFVLSEEGRGKISQTTKSDHKSYFAFFSKAKTKNANIRQESIDTADKIRNAIISRFGRNSAKEFDKVFKAGSEITVGKLKTLFNNFSAIEKNTCNAVVKSALLKEGIGSYTISAKVDKVVLGRADISVAEFTNLMNKAQSLMNNVEIDTNDLQTQTEDLEQVKDRLTTFKNILNKMTQDDQKVSDRELNNNNDLVTIVRESKVKNQLETITKALDEKIAANRKEIENNPRSVKNVRQGFSNVYNAGLQVLQKIANKYEQNNMPVPQQVIDLQRQYRMEINSLFAGRGDDALVSKDELKGVKDRKETVAKQLETLADASSPKIVTKRDISKAYKQAGFDILNKSNEWNPIKKTIPFTGFGRNTTLESNILPAGNLQVLNQVYQQDNIRGVSSTDRGNTHASNLAVTDLKGPNDTTLFKGIRHGVNSAFGIKDSAQRREANISRAKEVIAAAVEAKGLLGKAQNSTHDKPVEITIVSTSLLTPGVFLSNKEAKYLKDQNNSWNNACDADGICTLQVPDNNGNMKTIYVKPKVVTFNFPVNGYSHSTKGRIASFGGGYFASDPMIKQGIQDLIGTSRGNSVNGPAGLVGKYLQENPNIPFERKQTINTLVSQIKDLYNNKLYKDSNYDPYALPARIAVLADMIGACPAFNCKSGKDRTSVLDAEIKALAYQVSLNQVPDIRHSDADDRKLVQTMFREAGNHELQKYNTGFAGYKYKAAKKNDLQYIEGFAKLFPDNNNDFFLGSSAATKA